jgi:hypothetical protein
MKKQLQKARLGKIIKRDKEVIKTPAGKNIYRSKYNKLTGRTKEVEKDVEYKDKDLSTPKIVYKNITIVKRDKDKNWKSEKNTMSLKKDGKLTKKNIEYKTYKPGGTTKKVKVTAGGEKHVVYKKTTKKGEGKVGHIMVNHPTKDKGQWDTIDLTAKGRAKTVKEGVAATKKWHKDNPDYKYKGKKKTKKNGKK